jgi:hypothetical protein
MRCSIWRRCFGGSPCGDPTATSRLTVVERHARGLGTKCRPPWALSIGWPRTLHRPGPESQHINDGDPRNQPERERDGVQRRAAIRTGVRESLLAPAAPAQFGGSRADGGRATHDRRAR